MNDYIESPFLRTIQEREREQRAKERLIGWIVALGTLALMGWTAAIVSVANL